MYKQASRSFFRATQNNLRNAHPGARRCINTAPPHRASRSWKSSAARWGIAFAGIYYYNTHPMFADSTNRILSFESGTDQDLEASLPTVDSYSVSRKQAKEQQALSAQTALPATSEGAPTDDPEALEAEADQQGAFNPETGEINWDCPCLGGMAHGPCGQEFRNAFSCFIYSEQDPKGLDCIDKFKGMQDCFREHPDVYGAELDDDDELDADMAQEREAIQRDAVKAQSSQGGKRLLEEEAPSPLPYSPILSPEAPPARREPAAKPSQSQPLLSEPLAATTSSKASSQLPSHQQPPTQLQSSYSTPSGSSTPPSSEHPQSQDPSERQSSTLTQRSPEEKERVSRATQSTAENSKKFDEDLALMPKAWHDGTSAEVPSEGEKKSK